MFTNIINRFINVRNKIKDVEGNWVDQVQKREKIKSDSVYSLDVNGGEDLVVFEVWDKAIILESIELGTNDYELILKLHHKDDLSSIYDNQLFHTVGTGSSRGPASLKNLINDARISSYIKLGYFNESSGQGNLELKRPIYLPEGARLSIYTNNSDTKVTYKVVWREIEG